ncbi:helix-turn-helix transcriptional regulator, partial [Bacillales bacterium AN1005]
REEQYRLALAKKYTFDLISYIHHSLQTEELCLYSAVVERIVYSSDIRQMKDILMEYCYELIFTIHDHVHLRSPIVANLLTFIHTHFDQGLSLKTLGQQFHVNAIYLGQLFQKEVGVVFSEYINRYRLEKAKELLKTTHYRAGDIGKKVGYSDTTYFYKQFKKMVGTTPSEWRKI